MIDTSLRSRLTTRPLIFGAAFALLLGAACGSDSNKVQVDATKADASLEASVAVELRVNVEGGPFAPFSTVVGNADPAAPLGPDEGMAGDVGGVRTVGSIVGNELVFVVPNAASGTQSFRFSTAAGRVIVGNVSVGELAPFDVATELAAGRSALAERLSAVASDLTAMSDGPAKSAVSTLHADATKKLADFDTWLTTASADDQRAVAAVFRDRTKDLLAMDHAFDNVKLVLASKSGGADAVTVESAVVDWLIGVRKFTYGIGLLAAAVYAGPDPIGFAIGVFGAVTMANGKRQAIDATTLILNQAYVGISSELAKVLADFSFEEGVSQPILYAVNFRRPAEGDTALPVGWHSKFVTVALDLRTLLNKVNLGSLISFSPTTTEAGIPGGLAAVSVEIIGNPKVKALLQGSVDAPALAVTTTSGTTENFSFRMIYTRAGFQIISPVKTATVSSNCQETIKTGVGYRMVLKTCADPGTGVQTLFEKCFVNVNPPQPEACTSLEITTRDKTTKAERTYLAQTAAGVRSIRKFKVDPIGGAFVGEVLFGIHEKLPDYSRTKSTVYTGTTNGDPCTMTERSAKDGVVILNGAFSGSGTLGQCLSGGSTATGTPVTDESAAVRAVNALTTASSSLVAAGKCGTDLTFCNDWLP